MSNKRERELAKLKGPSSIKADRSKWSEESQRASYTTNEYHHSAKKCEACRAVFGISASSKKKWYEIWKIYIGSGPVRCADCQKELKALNAMTVGYQDQLKRSCSKEDLMLMRDTLIRLKKLAPKRFNIAIYNRICKKLDMHT